MRQSGLRASSLGMRVRPEWPLRLRSRTTRPEVGLRPVQGPLPGWWRRAPRNYGRAKARTRTPLKVSSSSMIRMASDMAGRGAVRGGQRAPPAGSLVRFRFRPGVRWRNGRAAQADAAAAWMGRKGAVSAFGEDRRRKARSPIAHGDREALPGPVGRDLRRHRRRVGGIVEEIDHGLGQGRVGDDIGEPGAGTTLLKTILRAGTQFAPALEQIAQPGVHAPCRRAASRRSAPARRGELGDDLLAYGDLPQKDHVFPDGFRQGRVPGQFAGHHGHGRQGSTQFVGGARGQGAGATTRSSRIAASRAAASLRIPPADQTAQALRRTRRSCLPRRRR